MTQIFPRLGICATLVSITPFMAEAFSQPCVVVYFKYEFQFEMISLGLGTVENLRMEEGFEVLGGGGGRYSVLNKILG